jgi:glycosyltransferase involved in cell wall biosynthesis
MKNNNAITFFIRNKNSGYSIRRVFEPIIKKISEYENVEVFELPCEKADLVSVVKNLCFVYKNRNKFKINHITGDMYYCCLALLGCKKIITIHDVGFIDNPQTQPFFLKRIVKWLFWVYLPVVLADKIVCVSYATKYKIQKYVPYKYLKKIYVIHNAVDPILVFTAKNNFAEPPIILQVGTGIQKNLDRTIISLKGLTCTFHIIGILTSKQKELLYENEINFINEYNLSNSDINDRLYKCDIVSFISLYEGFGMPIIEAQAVGRPVISSDIPPMDEVAGKGALLVDPYNIESIRNGFKTILCGNKAKNLIKEGQINKQRFDVGKIALEYFDLYKQCLLNNG